MLHNAFFSRFGRSCSSSCYSFLVLTLNLLFLRQSWQHSMMGYVVQLFLADDLFPPHFFSLRFQCWNASNPSWLFYCAQVASLSACLACRTQVRAVPRILLSFTFFTPCRSFYIPNHGRLWRWNVCDVDRHFRSHWYYVVLWSQQLC